MRVCLEASGNYSLDLALTLQAHRQVEISVLNPRRARRFAESLGQRSKTDPVDARVLCEYAARMPWVAWQPPSSVALHCGLWRVPLRTWGLSIRGSERVRLHLKGEVVRVEKAAPGSACGVAISFYSRIDGVLPTKV